MSCRCTARLRVRAAGGLGMHLVANCLHCTATMFRCQGAELCCSGLCCSSRHPVIASHSLVPRRSHCLARKAEIAFSAYPHTVHARVRQRTPVQTRHQHQLKAILFKVKPVSTSEPTLRALRRHHRWEIVPQYIEQFRIVVPILRVSSPNNQRNCPSMVGTRPPCLTAQWHCFSL